MAARGTTQKSIWREILVGVLIALAGGIAGLVSTRATWDTARCTEAVDIVTDDALSAALTDGERRRLAVYAAFTAEKCLEE